AGRPADPEHACGGRAVELQEDAQRDNLPLGRREPGQRLAELAGDGRRLLRLGCPAREPLLAPEPPLLRTQMVERGAARDLAEPRAGAAPSRVEAPPLPERPLERLAGEIL